MSEKGMAVQIIKTCKTKIIQYQKIPDIQTDLLNFIEVFYPGSGGQTTIQPAFFSTFC